MIFLIQFSENPGTVLHKATIGYNKSTENIEYVTRLVKN